VLTGHPSLEEAQAVGDRVKAAIGGPFTIAHSTLELECERCTDAESDPCLMDALGEVGGAGAGDDVAGPAARDEAGSAAPR